MPKVVKNTDPKQVDKKPSARQSKKNVLTKKKNKFSGGQKNVSENETKMTNDQLIQNLI